MSYFAQATQRRRILMDARNEHRRHIRNSGNFGIGSSRTFSRAASFFFFLVGEYQIQQPWQDSREPIEQLNQQAWAVPLENGADRAAFRIQPMSQ
jgi:hypothetical protein